MATPAPMPSASTRIAVAANPGFLRNCRMANRKILQCGLEAERHYILTLLENLRSVAKLSPRGVSCRFAGHTIRLKLLFRMLAMEGHFFSEFAAELFATNENPHLSKETSD